MQETGKILHHYGRRFQLELSGAESKPWFDQQVSFRHAIQPCQADADVARSKYFHAFGWAKYLRGAVTVQYPEERAVYPDIFRGRHL